MILTTFTQYQYQYDSYIPFLVSINPINIQNASPQAISYKPIHLYTPIPQSTAHDNLNQNLLIPSLHNNLNHPLNPQILCIFTQIPRKHKSPQRITHPILTIPILFPVSPRVTV